MLCGKGSVMNVKGSVPVYLNVYDLTSINWYAYWLGMGAYHSGIQVHNVEHSFWGHEDPTTGISQFEPKQCEGYTFRKSILIGWTEKTVGEVNEVVEKLGEKFRGDRYNLIRKNCNHFCNDFSIQLTGNPIPRWVNRLARIGFFCQCIVPANLNSTKVRDHIVEDEDCGWRESSLCMAAEIESRRRSEYVPSDFPPPIIISTCGRRCFSVPSSPVVIDSSTTSLPKKLSLSMSI